MQVNWDQGFRRVRWAFLGVSWLIFLVAHWDANPARIGENSVYMLFFTGGVVLFARLCIWVVRGFLGSPPAVSSGTGSVQAPSPLSGDR
jgi:hypothetical protein